MLYFCMITTPEKQPESTENKKKKDYTIEELKGFHKHVLTDEVLRKLEEAFKCDFTDEEACDYAGISSRTYYTYCKLSTEFAEKMEAAKRFIFAKAKKILVNALVNEEKNGGSDNAWKLLERRQRGRYATRTEKTGADGTPLNADNKDLLTSVLSGITDLLKKDDNTIPASSEGSGESTG